jgi:hypothetical protein
MENSNEAPASITYSITSKDGFNALFTVRDDMVKNLFTKMELVEKTLLDKGYKPQVKQSWGSTKPPAEIVPDRKCPLCSQSLVYATTKDGKKFIKCSTNKWDFATKQATGCKFTEWEDKLPTKVNSEFTAF